MFVTNLPGPVGAVLRYRYWRKRVARMGENVRIDTGVLLLNAACIHLEDGCWIDRNVTILAGAPGGSRVTHEIANPDFTMRTGEVRIGAASHIAPNCVLSGLGGLSVGCNCTIAANSSIYSFSHHYRNLADSADRGQYSFSSRARADQQAMILGAVTIGDYCAVGLNSVLLPGTSLGTGSWVGAHQVVSGRHGNQLLLYSTSKPQQKSLERFQIIR
jgi:acetyltransferase-like isoleucine patch superfamily enzyme